MRNLGRFFEGIYGFDGLSCGLILLGVVMNLIMGLVPSKAVNQCSVLSFLPLLICILRVLSHNHERRRRENQRFIAMIRPLCESMIRRGEEREEAKLFRFFKCPACGQKLRVPKGKGRVEITCPKCGERFIKKA